MPIDLSKISNEELMRIARQGQQDDVASLSNDELFKIAGIKQKETYPFSTSVKGKSLFPEIPPEEQVKHPYLSAIAKTGQDILTIPASFGNQLLMDYPRRITERMGYSYPSETENVAAGGPAKIAGVVGGFKNPVFKAFGGGLKATLGRNMMAGAATGATYSPSKFESPEQIAGEQISKAVGGALLPPVMETIPAVASGVSGIGKYVFSKGAGLSQNAMNTVSKLGFSKVRDVANKGINYIQEDVIPRARQALIKNITSAGEASKELLQEMGFNPEQIKDVLKISKVNMAKYGSQINTNWVKTEENIGKALVKVGKQIGEVYSQAAREGKTININNTIRTMRSQLQQMGMVDKTGNLIGDYKTHPSTAIKNMAQLYSEYAPRIGKGDIQIADFLNFRTRLEASVTKFPEGEKFNVPIYKALKVLKDDSVNSLAQKGSPYEAFWRNINKEYSDLKSLDFMSQKINAVVNNLPNKIMTQRNKLTESHMKLYGKDIVNDVEAYNAARELYPEKETIGLFNVQKPAIREAFKRTEQLKEAARPVTAPIGKTVRQIGRFGTNVVSGIMKEPTFSPQTKSFFAQAPNQVGAKLEGKSGQVIFGREEPQNPVFGPKPLPSNLKQYPQKGDYIQFKKDGLEYFVEHTDSKRMYLIDTKGQKQDIPINSPVIIKEETIAQSGANPQGKQGIVGGDSAIGVTGLTAAGTLMTGQAQADDKKIQSGEASTYGWGEKLNKHTFSGEVFNPDGLTAAMRDVPMGTKIRVTDKNTKKSVVLTVNDGGPNIRTKRVVDLSKGAWKALGYNKAGLTNVDVEIIKLGTGKKFHQ